MNPDADGDGLTLNISESDNSQNLELVQRRRQALSCEAARRRESILRRGPRSVRTWRDEARAAANSPRRAGSNGARIPSRRRGLALDQAALARFPPPHRAVAGEVDAAAPLVDAVIVHAIDRAGERLAAERGDRVSAR